MRVFKKNSLFLNCVFLFIPGFIFADSPNIKNLQTLSRQWRVDLVWELLVEGKLSYEVQRSEKADGGFKVLPKKSVFPIFTDFIGSGEKSFYYQVRTVYKDGKKSQWSKAVKGTTLKRNDAALLDEVQEAHVRHMTIAADPNSGLAYEWLNSDSLGGSNVGALGGTGLGLTNYVVAVERKFLSRQEACQKILKTLRFLDQKAERFHGVFPHWINNKTGKTIPFSKFDDGGDLVEMAMLVQGLIILREYFNLDNEQEKEIRTLADKIWKGVDWNWYRKDGGHSLYWHWSPKHGWKINMKITGFNEAEIVYLLAMASPTHPVPADCYFKGWRTPWYGKKRQKMGIDLELYHGLGGCSFWYYYSYIGFDPRRIKYGTKTNFEHFQDLTKLQIKYMKSKADKFNGYGSLWGLTASPNPDGYAAHKPGHDNGTICPPASLSSITYTPEESLACLKEMYYKHGARLWKEFGFVEAFNFSKNWTYKGYLAIDTAPVAPMIENYRTGLIWKLFMNAPEIKAVMQKLEAASPGVTVPADQVEPVKR